MKYVGLLYLFISKVSSRIGVSLKDGKGMPLSLLPPPFLPLLSPFILSPFSIPSLLSLSSLLSSISLSPILIACSFFISLSTLPSSSPFPLPFSRYPLLPSFSPPVLFLFLSPQFYFYLSVTLNTMFYYSFKFFAESTVIASQKAILRIHL